MSSTSPKKPVTNVRLLESLDLLRGNLYDLSVLIHQFIDNNTEAPNNFNREKLLNFVCEVKKSVQFPKIFKDIYLTWIVRLF